MNVILFDLDNTLTHRAKTVENYVHAFISHFKDQLTQPVNSAMLSPLFVALDQGGYAGHDQRSTAICELPIWQQTPLSASVKEHWQKWVPFNAVPMPGLDDLFTTLIQRGYHLGIITNGNSRNQRAKIIKLQLEQYCSLILVSEEFGSAKPDPAIFEYALTTLNVKPTEVLFVGDHPVNDYAGAKQLGITPIWFQGFHQWPANTQPATLAIDSLSELVPLIDRHHF